MKKHTKKYMDCMGYDDTSFIPCEVCGKPAVDIHHISSRGMGGTSIDKDTCDNLMAVCRECHNKYGDKKQYVEFLKKKHENMFNI
jgi:ribosome-binding protein aMBF1 (putative translation factor)